MIKGAFLSAILLNIGVSQAVAEFLLYVFIVFYIIKVIMKMKKVED